MKKLRAKRAQAAMEFLMTYGWALLVVLVAIGALAFFGVLSPGQFLPDQCVLFAGLTCSDYYAQATGSVLRFDVQNGLGYTMYDMTIEVESEGDDLSPQLAGTNDCTAASDLSDGQTTTCEYDQDKSQGDKIKGIITVAWDDTSGVGGTARSRTGNLALTVET